jgi:replicative DNA helicase
MADAADSARKLPPQSIESERAVLGGILLENDAFFKAAEVLNPDDFYRESHKRIFRRMMEISERSEPIDIITLGEALKSRGELEELGGSGYLAELASSVPTAANIAYHAKIVREKGVLRFLIRSNTEIITQAYQEPGNIDAFLDEAERSIMEVSQRRVRGAFVPIKEIILDSIKTVEKLYERKEMVTGVPTGFTKFDRLTAGLQPSDLIVIAGRPSMGKTALALNIGQHAALEHGVGVALFSLEMAKEQLVLRMLCSEARVDHARVRAGYLGERDFPRLAMAAGRLADAQIYIDDSPALGVMELRSKARRLVRDRDSKVGLVIVDYLQLMRGYGDGRESREQEISAITRSLKSLAKELHVPVVALSQLNRQVEQRQDRRPILADLRESGAIEQDADVIAFIYRDEVYHRDSRDTGIAEIIIGKQRNGPIGIVRLAFLKEFTRFENLAEREDVTEVADAAPF